MFRKISTGFGALCLMMGIIVMAGSAGDCDGKCMEVANTLPEMLMLAGVGVILCISGAFFIVVGRSE